MGPDSIAGVFPDLPPRLLGYCLRPDAFTTGNKLALLRDGRQAYPAMLEAIASARACIHLETYILQSDRTGQSFADALSRKAREGVSVRLIYDAIGSLGLSEGFLQSLRNAGIQALEYHPVAPWRRRWGWGRRDHRKTLVVDGRVGFAGGINIADDYADPEQGGGGWHDFHVRVEGPAAHELDRHFRAVWFKETGRFFPLPEPSGDPPGSSLVHVAANQEFIKRFFIRRAFLNAIERSRRRIVIASAYFIPDRGLRKAFAKACRRGVAIDVLLPAVSDVPAANYASRRLFKIHLDAGLRLHLYPGRVLHAKAMVVDRAWAAVGSYNITHRSLLHNLESNLHVLDPGFAGRLEDELLSDVHGAKELLADIWESRPLPERVLERVFYWLRHWF